MRLLQFLLASILITACSLERAPLVVTDVSIKAPLPGMQMTAAYFTLTNNTSQMIKISNVTSPQFGTVEMHESVIEDGMARMYPLRDFTILAGDTVRFEPGGKHLMLMRPAGEFQSVTIEFHANKASILSVNAPLSD
jgi:copper(I)-binding protein